MRNVWNPVSNEKKKRIILKLFHGDMGFTELWESLRRGTKGMAKQTLNIYLKELRQTGCVKNVQRGRWPIYSLVREHTYVDDLLKRVGFEELVKIKSERELLDDWIESMKFSLLNLIQIYMQMGKGIEILTSLGNGAFINLENLRDEYLSDLIEICQYWGDFLADGIKIGNLDPEIVWEVRNEILEEIKSKRSTKT